MYVGNPLAANFAKEQGVELTWIVFIFSLIVIPLFVFVSGMW